MGAAAERTGAASTTREARARWTMPTGSSRGAPMASADGTTLTLAPPSGDPLRLRFQPAGLGQPQGEASAEAIPSAWIVDGEVDWSEVSSLGLLSAVFEDGRELAIATVRPRGAEGHDAETISSHLTEESEHVEI